MMTTGNISGQHGMTVVEHLEELRDRLKWSVYGFLCALAVTLLYSEQAYNFLAEPLLMTLPESSRFMAFSGIVEPFITYLKVSLTFALILASPIIFFQFWSFVAPGLKSTEKKWMLPIVFLSVLLFVGGAAFAYYIVLPMGFKYLLGYSSDTIQPYLSMSIYFGLVTKMLLAFGIIFLEPLVVLILSKIGVVSISALLGFSRYLVVIAVIVGAIVTPPDVVSQILLAVPIIILYFVGILLAYLFRRRGGEEITTQETDN